KPSRGEESLYKFGPAWDFDVAFNFLASSGDGSYEEISPDSKLWINELLKRIIKTPEFMPLYKAELERFASEDLPELLEFVRSYAVLIDPSSKMDAYIWPETADGGWYERRPASDVVERAEKLCRWLVERVNCLLERADKSEL
ncbi:MAG: CotH kinase family protein, partial [Muribaculaceae bacterium]|nr:CotH kinase family protein [Muribaculaceae bacterium]